MVSMHRFWMVLPEGVNARPIPRQHPADSREFLPTLRGGLRTGHLEPAERTKDEV